MDPLSLTTACVALIAAAGKTSIAVAGFIRGCLEARSDLTTVAGELAQLQLVIDLIKDDGGIIDHNVTPAPLQTQILSTINNCSAIITQLNDVLQKYQGKGGAAKWATYGKPEITLLRMSLEAHRGSLNLALELVSLSLSKATKDDTSVIRARVHDVKNDTSQIPQIMEELKRLQALVAGEIPSPFSGRQYVLQQYLDNLTSYAETICSSVVWDSDHEGSVRVVSREPSLENLGSLAVAEARKAETGESMEGSAEEGFYPWLQSVGYGDLDGSETNRIHARTTSLGPAARSARPSTEAPGDLLQSMLRKGTARHPPGSSPPMSPLELPSVRLMNPSDRTLLEHRNLPANRAMDNGTLALPVRSQTGSQASALPVATVILNGEEHTTKGIECHEKGAMTEATYHFSHAAKLGHPTGMLLYALACRHGWGMRSNHALGTEWLQKAANISLAQITATQDKSDGDPDAGSDAAPADQTRKAQFALSIYELGVSHMNGWGVKQDRALALRCFEIAGGELPSGKYCHLKAVESLLLTWVQTGEMSMH